MPPIRQLPVLVFMASFLLMGCSPPSAEPLPGTPIHGKVSIGGKEPKTYLSFEFVSISDPSQTGSGGVDPQGNYSARVPLGKCKVWIKTSMGSGPPGGGGQSGGGQPPGAFPKGGGPGGSGGQSAVAAPPKLKDATEIPKRYLDLKTTDMQVEILSAEQELNIDFKDK